MELGKAQGSGPVGPELWQLHLEAQGLQYRLHLELESFFMFGTVFLDRAAGPTLSGQVRLHGFRRSKARIARGI